MTAEQAVFESRLDFFAAHALQGLCANQMYHQPQYQKYLQQKNMTLETMAINSALEIMEQIENVRLKLKKHEETIKNTVVQVDKKLESIRTGEGPKPQ